MKKYLIIGSYIYSKNDLDLHYVNAHKLMRLYNLKREECILLENNDHRLKQYKHRDDLKKLSVLFHGDYNLND